MADTNDSALDIQIKFPIVDKEDGKTADFELDTRSLTVVTPDTRAWESMYGDEFFWNNKQIKYILIQDDNGKIKNQALLMRDGLNKSGSTGGNYYTLYSDERPSEKIVPEGRGTARRTITAGGGNKINLTVSGQKGIGNVLKNLLTGNSGNWDEGYYNSLLDDTENQGKDPIILNPSNNVTAVKVLGAIQTLVERSKTRLKVIFYLDDTGKAGAADDLTERMCNLIRHGKHQIVFHGAPGTGKTFTARQVAQSFVWGKTQLDGEPSLGELNRLFDYYRSLSDSESLYETLKDLITRLLGDQTPYADKEILYKAYFGDRQDGSEKKKVPEADAAAAVKEINALLGHVYETWKNTSEAERGPEPKYAKKKYELADLQQDLWDMQGRVELIQFHPSYDYTDFVEGLRPVEAEAEGTDGKKTTAMEFRRVDGQFMHFCRFVQWRNAKIKAAYEEDPKKTSKKPELVLPRYFFIIDEINRADLSKVLGELMYAMESDKRDTQIPTQYSNLTTWFPPEERDIPDFCSCFDEGFMIPSNVVILGTMNDIDRSVESMDFAMRRRFVWQRIRVDHSMLYQAFRYGRIFRKVFDGSQTDTEDKEEKICTELAGAVEKFNMEGLQEKNQPTRDLTKNFPEFASGDYDIAQGLFTDIRKDDLESKNITVTGTATAIMNHVWEYRVSSLLREYLRGSPREEELFQRLKGKWEEARDSIADRSPEQELWEVLRPGVPYDKESEAACKAILDTIKTFNNSKALNGVDFMVSAEDFAYLDDTYFANGVPDSQAILRDVWAQRIAWPLLRALKEKDPNAQYVLNPWEDPTAAAAGQAAPAAAETAPAATAATGAD